MSIFSRNATRVTLATESFDIEAVDPPAPQIRIDSRYHYNDELYMVPMDGGFFGDAILESELADMDVRLVRDGQSLTDETFQPGRVGTTNRVFRRLATEPMAMWDEASFQIEAGYHLLPEVATASTLRAVAVPNDSITPLIDVETSQALDSDPLPVTVRMVNRQDLNGEYDAETMGQWSIRLTREEGVGDRVAMTDFVDAPNGEVQFQVDLSGIERSVRLVAEARLHSPIEGYERIEASPRLFLSVLRGGAIDADVTARRLSGPAPFSTVLQLDVENWLDISATGDVTWQVSADGGATWDEQVETDRNRFRWRKTFERGQYLVRAHVKNAHSGAQSWTETVEVIAYHQAKATIVGDQTLFVGTSQTYEVQIEDPSGNPMEGAEIKWTLTGARPSLPKARPWSWPAMSPSAFAWKPGCATRPRRKTTATPTHGPRARRTFAPSRGRACT